MRCERTREGHKEVGSEMGIKQGGGIMGKESVRKQNHKKEKYPRL